jgi:phage shock protein PspC (stress-responsive transcriptional regulator)
MTINLGGRAFIIDEDAYIHLKDYFAKIEMELNYSSDKSEIIEDIEIRVAEILRETLQSSKEVVDLNDINEIIRTMGNPSDFGHGYEQGSYEQHQKQSRFKRVYRDPDNSVLGGVCGGLGAYFNFDPIILRVVFVISLLFFGTGFFVYIILWIVVPEAKTIAQKLEMRGEPVNISNIGDKIKEEFNNVKRKMKL